VRLTARELADKVNNDLAGVAGVLRLLESYSAAPEGLRGMLPEALAALEHACQAITRLHSVTRIETHATPFGPALDLERSVSTPEDPRPLVAGEGESSQEADSGAGPLQLGYEEMLRTVGAWLDVADHDLVLLDVSPQAAAIETVGPAGRDRFVIGEIAQYARARRRLRGQGEEHPTDGTVLRREWILRVIGAELDRVGEARYDLIVTRSSVRVDGAAGYHRIFDGDTLARLIEEATRRRLDGAPAPSPPP
jgi:hypothetical protein